MAGRAFASDARFLPVWASTHLQVQHQHGEAERLESQAAASYLSLEDWKRSSGYYNAHDDEDDAVSVASYQVPATLPRARAREREWRGGRPQLAGVAASCWGPVRGEKRSGPAGAPGGVAE